MFFFYQRATRGEQWRWVQIYLYPLRPVLRGNVRRDDRCLWKPATASTLGNAGRWRLTRKQRTAKEKTFPNKTKVKNWDSEDSLSVGLKHCGLITIPVADLLQLDPKAACCHWVQRSWTHHCRSLSRRSAGLMGSAILQTASSTSAWGSSRLVTSREDAWVIR